jgi:hypothetical protein
LLKSRLNSLVTLCFMSFAIFFIRSEQVVLFNVRIVNYQTY